MFFFLYSIFSLSHLTTSHVPPLSSFFTTRFVCSILHQCTKRTPKLYILTHQIHLNVQNIIHLDVPHIIHPDVPKKNQIQCSALLVRTSYVPPLSYISTRLWYILFPLQKYNGQLPCHEIQLKMQLENASGRRTPKLGCTKIYLTKGNNAWITGCSKTFENKVRHQKPVSKCSYILNIIFICFQEITSRTIVSRFTACYMLGHRVVHCCGGLGHHHGDIHKQVPQLQILSRK